MKKELIKELLNKFENACYELDGIECWSARDLQLIFGYSEWRNFFNAILKAQKSCEAAVVLVAEHFVDINKMIQVANGAAREVDDIALSRYACYLIAQNGDPAKLEVAFAQSYFAVQTRRQEIIEQRLLEHERLKAREKLSQTEKQLSGILYERGIDIKALRLFVPKEIKLYLNY